MPDERRAALRRTYLSLGTGELAAASVFAAAAAGAMGPRLEARNDFVALWSALGPLIVILVQAGIYWLLARTWVELAPMPAGVADLYRLLRVLDPVLLAAGLVGVLGWLPDRVDLALLILVAWAFGAVEYVNYFVIRLAYPIRRWPCLVGQWRTPRLVQDLNSAR